MSQGNRGKSASNVLGRRRRMRRQWLTFIRMCRYGIESFSRNAWLTTAAVVVMTVTLLIIFGTVAARNVFADTIDFYRQDIDLSFYLRDDVTEEQRETLQSRLQSQAIVTNVRYISQEEARRQYAQDSAAREDLEQLEALNVLGDDNPLPASFRIDVSDPDDLDQLASLCSSDEFKAAQNPDADSPLCGGARRATIDSIANAATTVERIGLALSLIAVIISTLIIFNTIRMAIFNRRDEIRMMKLIGADRNFIQGPFIVEAVLYGMLAAVAASGIAYAVILTQATRLNSEEIALEPTLQLLTTFPGLVVFALVIVGALIGVVSSYLAIRRYLKV